MQVLLPQIIFYIFAALTIISAVLVISQNNPVRCVLALIFTFLFSSVLWILARAEFLALILVLVYIGAVMTLFLFVVMMLNINIESIKANFKHYLLLGVAVVSIMTILLLVAMNSLNLETGPDLLEPTQTTAVNNFANDTIKDMSGAVANTEALGLILYTDYLYAFELAAVLLLVAIIGSITLVHRKAKNSKNQNVVQQMMTEKKDRLVIVKMKAGE